MHTEHEKKLRFDLQVIAEGIEPASRVLDLGCGTGDLLAWLAKHKNVRGTGIDQNQENVAKCISRGLSVLQGDINEEVDDYPDDAFDYVILSQTLQQVYEPDKLLQALSRIGKYVVVSFPNFSHYSIRLFLLLKGKAPANNHLPYLWYDTPNIRVVTMKDFREFTQEVGYNIVKETAINTNPESTEGHIIHRFINLRATYGIFFIEKSRVL